MLDRTAIEAIIPHRAPFLLVDRIIALEPGKSAVGELDVREDAFWVPGHFPQYAVMPGVLIVEALAQVGAVALLSMDAFAGKLAFFAGIDGVRFKRQVRPGDTLRLTVTLDAMRRGIGKGQAIATVDGALAARGELIFAVGDAPEP
ncbi:MAG: 3-hydroxyacyl-ACP dehydratase FabZ [Thermomicrobiales bacterium]